MAGFSLTKSRAEEFYEDDDNSIPVYKMILIGN